MTYDIFHINVLVYLRSNNVEILNLGEKFFCVSCLLIIDPGFFFLNDVPIQAYRLHLTDHIASITHWLMITYIVLSPCAIIFPFNISHMFHNSHSTAGAITKNDVKSGAGLQYHHGRVGRGVKTPSTAPPNTHIDIKHLKRLLINRRTGQRTDKASYRVACPQLKTKN